MRCDRCFYHVLTECHRFPPVAGFAVVADNSWCGEYKEVVVCPVVEKEKVEKAKVEEKAESNPIKKRGWPKGMPRKIAI